MIALNIGVIVFAILKGLGLPGIFALFTFPFPLVVISYLDRGSNLRSLAQWAMVSASNVGAPCVWMYSNSLPDGQATGPRVLAMLLWGFPNAAWLAPVLVRWRREFLRLSGGWEQSETSPEKLPAAAAVARGPHVGSNDPCPRGSGRQYKKCHGTAEVGV